MKKAEELAIALSAKVWILHNAEPEPGFVEFKIDPQSGREAFATKFYNEHLQIQDIVNQLHKTGLDATALLVHGATVETILKEASDLDVDMIVVGTHGQGAMYHLLVGSVSERILHKSRYPVLVIPTHKHID